MPRGREWLLVTVALVVALVCVRLGFWQLSRLATRRAHNAEIRAARQRPPLELTGAVPVDSVIERPVIVRGEYDYSQERLWRGRLVQGIPGVHILTPLRLSADTAVLVDRGWVASPDAARLELDRWRGPDSAVVQGVGARLPRGRGDVDPLALDDSLPYALLPFAVQQVSGGDHAAPSPRASQGGMGRPVIPPPTPLTNGPHVGYAIQWFSFALIVLIGTFALLRGSRRRQLPS